MKQLRNGKILQNDFIGGMNMDMHAGLQDTHTYTYARNINLMFDKDGNTGSIKAYRSHQPITIVYPQTGVLWHLQGEDILNIETIRDSLVFITAVPDRYAATKTTNRVWKASSVANTNQIELRLYVDCNMNLGETVSLQGRFEDFDNMSIYVADGKNYIRKILIYDPNPSIITDISIIDTYKDLYLEPPKFLSFGSGSLMSGSVQYLYQLFNKNSSGTDISFCSAMIPLYKDSSNASNIKGSFSSINTTKSVVLEVKNSWLQNKYQYIRLYRIYYSNNIDNPQCSIVLEDNFANNKILIDYGQKLLDIAIEDILLRSTKYDFKPNIILSKNDILYLAGIQEISNAVLQDIIDYDVRLFGFPKKSSYVTVENGDNEAVGQVVYSANGTYIFQNIWLDGFNKVPLVWLYMQHQYLSQNAAACFLPTTTSSATNFGLGGVNVVMDLVTTPIIHNLSLDNYNSTVMVKRVMHSNSIPIYRCGAVLTALLKTLELPSTGWTDYSNPLYYSLFASLQRNLIYRFGCIMIDKNGNESRIKWITDYRTPDVHIADSNNDYNSIDNNSSLFASPLTLETTSSGLHKMYLLGTRFTFRNVPLSVDRIKLVRLVRREEDKNIICQGILGKTVRTYERGNPVWRESIPNILNLNNGDTGVASLQFDSPSSPPVWRNSWTGYMTLGDNYLFYSPDVSYLKGKTDEKWNLLTHISVLTDLNSMYRWVGMPDYPVGEIGQKYNIYNWFLHREQAWQGSFYFMSSTLAGGCVNGQNSDKIVETLENIFIQGYDKHPLLNSQAIHILDRRFYGLPDISSNQIIDGDEAFSVYTPSRLDRLVSINKLISLGVGENYHLQDALTALDLASHQYSINGTEFYNYKMPSCEIYQLTGNISEGGMYNKCGPGSYGLLISTNFAINTNTDTFTYYSGMGPDATMMRNSYCLLVNLTHDVIPYGGATEYARLSNDYRVLNECDYSDSTSSGNRTISIIAFDGDVYPGLADILIYNSSYKTGGGDNSHLSSCRYIFPCESYINLDLASGRKFDNINNITECWVEPFTSQYSKASFDEPMYMFNLAYTLDTKINLIFGSLRFVEYNKYYDCRILLSQPKTNDELGDNWMNFKSFNFLDLDSEFGLISLIKHYNNRLIAWQENAVLIVQAGSALLLDQGQESLLLLGNGGPLERYDYILTNLGIKSGQILASLDLIDKIYFWDLYRNSIWTISGLNMTNFGQVKGIQSYLQRFMGNKDYPRWFFHADLNELHFCWQDYRMNSSTINNNVHLVILENKLLTSVPTSFISQAPALTFISNGILYDIRPSDLEHKDLKIYTHCRGNNFKYQYDSSTERDYTIHFIVNDNYQDVKVFDNMWISSIDNKNVKVLDMWWYTEQGTSNDTYDLSLLNTNPVETKYRNGNVIMQVKRVLPNDKRHIGKSMEVHMNMRIDSNDITFNIPSVNTSYRTSQL